MSYFGQNLAKLHFNHVDMHEEEGNTRKTGRKKREEEVLIGLVGYWRQRADDREASSDPPQRWMQEPLVARDRDGRPQTGPSGSALLLCVCVVGVHC